MATHVFPTMGTVASLRFRGEVPDRNLLQDLHDHFEELEQRFSLYRADSEISRINDGSSQLTRASESMLAAYDLALRWRTDTGGAFTPHRPDGLLDLSGVVKALAIHDAGGILREAGVRDWLVTVGGDTLSDGTLSDGTLAGGVDADRWTAGIVDPADRTALLCAVPFDDRWRAIATSGTAERGEHVWRRPESGHLVQVTVLGPDIITADVLATAILAGGTETLDLATDTWPIDVLCVAADGGLAMTPRLRDHYLARAS
ncbi:FAD:protein FMN transferase [Cryobacterium sp. SO2]|uniref:FAD:protein FMN transferase n=1 Tax=Cryobacterium sp. SO2 TaxID=1897060 RepID=UPI0023DA5193|nr:FAD:protein FMN transferase [Cryobacterium sp. SO2]WEO78893.1 FAD:protein FMN transferase [Cryobacterium sp. SO2]